MRRVFNVGLIGFGTVGSGLVKILQKNRAVIDERLGVKVRLKAIADKDLRSRRPVRVDRKLLTRDARAVLRDPGIDIIVELVGGFEPARSFILEAVRNGKHVVTANKALLAKHGSEIFEAAARAGVEVAFEAAVAGGIPIIKAVRESFAANRILSIYGIINGTANYILTRMTGEGLDFGKALAEAQALGLAESDPSMDVGGHDAAHKLAILASLGFGGKVRLSDVYTEGITGVRPEDIRYAREFGYRVKLLAIAKESGGELETRVHPTLIPEDHLLASVSGAFNACYVRGDAVGETMFYGQGAGMLPTGSAVAADVMDLVRKMRDGAVSPPPGWMGPGRKLKLRPMSMVECPYYFRFTVIDRPGVLASISSILGRHSISIASMFQQGRRGGKGVPIVMLAHDAKEKDVRAALRQIDRLKVVVARTVLIRVEAG